MKQTDPTNLAVHHTKTFYPEAKRTASERLTFRIMEIACQPATVSHLWDKQRQSCGDSQGGGKVKAELWHCLLKTPRIESRYQ